MKKQISDATDVTLTIEVGTTIIIDEVEYYGTVTVNKDIAEAIKKTGKVKEDEPKDA